MHWSGLSFTHIKVKQGSAIVPMPISEALSLPYRKEMAAYRTIWSQPFGSDGLLAAYYGSMIFRFAGIANDFNGLTALPSVRTLVERLIQMGIPKQAIDVTLAVPDFYVLVQPSVFGLRPDPLFPFWCARLAAEIASDLPYDPDIYCPDAMMPIVGSRLSRRSYCISIPHNQLHLSGGYLVAYAAAQRPVRKTRKMSMVLNARSCHPYRRSLRPELRRRLPEGVVRLLHEELDEAKLETACFTIALAVKDMGGTPNESAAMLNMNRSFRQLPAGRAETSIQRAFENSYRFGYRSFARRFPEFSRQVRPEKSPFIVFQRSWLRRLEEIDAPYTAHKLLFELLGMYHAYPRPTLPVPENWSPKALRAALASLTSAGIAEFVDGEIRLCFDHDERSSHYVRIPAEYALNAAQTKQAVRLFSLLISSSLHKKAGMWCALKMDTITRRLGISLRTVFYHLKTLRDAGITIGTDLSLCFGRFLHQKSVAESASPVVSIETKESIQVHTVNHIGIGVDIYKSMPKEAASAWLDCLNGRADSYIRANRLFRRDMAPQPVVGIYRTANANGPPRLEAG